MKIPELKAKLIDSVQKNGAGALLFSGGLDSSVLASINPKIKGITVSLGSFGKDIGYADRVAELFGIEHYKRAVDIEEAIQAIPEVIKILKTFDPAIPNDIVVYFALKEARALGIGEVMTGDGSDELFGGYSFMEDIDDLDGYIKKIINLWHFNSNDLGRYFNIRIKQPYIDTEVINFSLGITKDFRIKQIDNKVWGKWILRKAFEDILPREIIWQDKRPLEYGSGMNRLREIIESKVSDEEFREKRQVYPIKFMNKEHLYYYEIYRREFGDVPNAGEGEVICSGCGAGMRDDALHCNVCGWVELNRRR